MSPKTIATTARNTSSGAGRNAPPLAALVCQRCGVRLAGWSLAMLLVVGSVGYGQGKDSVTVEIVPSRSEKQLEPSPAVTAKLVLTALGADMSLQMANFGFSADEALSTEPEPREMAFALIQIVSPKKITRYSSLNNRITLSPIDDFNAFCNAIDYARILEKNRSRRYVKIRIKHGELTKENLVKRAKQAGREELTDQLYGDNTSEKSGGGRFSGFSIGRSAFGQSSGDDDAAFKAGDAVEVEIGNDRHQGVIVKWVEESKYIVSLTDTKALAQGLPDRRMQRAVARLDSLPIIAPSDFLRPSRRPSGPAATARVWKDKSGRFEVEATYVSQTSDTVKIQKQDGSILTVPLAKLSREDRDYLAGLSRQAPSGGSGGLRPVYAKELSVDRSNARVIRLADVRPGPPPAVAPAASSSFSAAAKTLAIDYSKDTQGEIDVLTRLEFATSGSRGIALWNANLHGQLPQQLLAFDATKNKAHSLIRLRKSQHVFDMEPDRGLVILGGKRGPFVEAKRLTISRVADNKITPLLEWSPYRNAAIDGRQLHSAGVDAAWFLAGSRVLTKSEVGRLWTIWRLTKQQAIAEVDFITDHVEFSNAWVRRDGRVAAISAGGAISLLNVSQGRVIRQIPVRGDRYSGLTFSEDGQKLAAARRGELRTWDLSKGEVDRELWHPALGEADRIDWVGDNLLVDGEYLFDMKHSVLLWEYRGGYYGAAADKGSLWSVEGRRGSGPKQLSTVSIPHQAAVEVMDRLESDPTLTLARSGDQVGLKIRVPKSHADKAEVISVVSDRLRAAGYELVDGQKPALMMVVTATPMKVEKVEVYEKGEWHLGGKKPVVRNFVPHLWKCDLQLDGMTILRQTSIWGSGPVIQMKSNDSPGAAVARSQKAQVSRVIPATIPNKVSRPGTATEIGAYGASRVTAEGLLDASQ